MPVSIFALKRGFLRRPNPIPKSTNGECFLNFSRRNRHSLVEILLTDSIRSTFPNMRSCGGVVVVWLISTTFW